ncbi:MAG TPA: sigma-70 family RNA polymerase sigma factor [Polyangiaceae bacterium]|nr:sigma-70 family RNA polymerase sigma factor [Polyangiaceae bacterium]
MDHAVDHAVTNSFAAHVRLARSVGARTRNSAVTCNGLRCSATSCVSLALVLPGISMSSLSDAELAALVASREGRAEAQLFLRFAPRIELYGLKHLRDRAGADDLVQQVMLRVLEAVREGRLEDPTKLTSFVFGTCRNVTWDLRRARRREQRLEREATSLEATVGPPTLGEQEIARLFASMNTLSERESTIVRMTFFEDRTTDDIAARLALTASNVRVIRHRALAKLAKRLHAGELS